MVRFPRPLAALALLGLLLPARSLATLHAGAVAPDFRGTDLNGVSRTLFQYHGQIVVLFVLAYF